MRKIILSSASITLVAFFAAININAQSKDDLKSTVARLDNEICSAMVSGNTEKSLSFYTRDAISLPNYNKMLIGLDAIKRSSEDMTGAKLTSFELTPYDVKSYGNIVVEIGTYKSTMTSTENKSTSMDPMHDQGKYLTVWEKQKDGTLKIKNEIWNSDSSPMQNMENHEEMEHMQKKQ